MKQPGTRRGACLIVAFFIVAACFPLEGAFGQERKHVLILHSYHPEYSWTGDVDKGMRGVLENAAVAVDTRTEYMDGKHFPGGGQWDLLGKLYTEKFGDLGFDLILASDDDALGFLLKWRDRIFPGVPVVFCGVNDYDPDLLSGHKGYAGVTEGISIRETIDLALKLRPATDHIWFSGDETATTRGIHRAIRDIAPLYSPGVRFTFSRETDAEKVKGVVEALGENSVVFFQSRLKNHAGRKLPFFSAIRMMASAANLPIFSCWDIDVGAGAVGGKVVSGLSQGEAAAGIAVRILRGEDPGGISVLEGSVNRFIFDERELARFDIDRGLLPEDSVVLNGKVSFYETHGNVLLISTAVTVLLMAVIFVLQGSMTGRRRAERSLVKSEERFITKRKETEDALRESEENLAITLDSIGDAVIATDAKGRITRMNLVAQSLTGWSMEDGAEKPLSSVMELVSVETGTRIPCPAEKVLKTGKIVNLEENTVLRARNGAERRVSDSAAPIRNTKGDIVGVVIVFSDITEKHRLEEQCRQAQKMDSLGQLAGGVAHDFNNMLAGIIGYAEILSIKLSHDEELTASARYIRNAGERAAELTKKLLDFSRKGKVQSTPLDLHISIDNTIALLERSIDKRITIEKRFSAKRAVVIGDPSQIQSAVLNLGINARDAMPQGGILTIETKNVRLDKAYCEGSPFEINPGKYVDISVSDTGTGIKRAVMDRIFEPFFTTKGEGKGTGLGLSAVYGSIKDHNGAVTVDSREGEGSSFHLFLPLDSPEVVEIRDVGEVVTGSGCILVVDDEEVVRKMSTQILEEMGYIVLTARDGLEAVEIFKKENSSISLVLLDMVMPRMDGRETYYAMRKIDPNVKVIIASGFSRSENISYLIRKEGLRLMQKPFRRVALSRIVAGAIRG